MAPPLNSCCCGCTLRTGTLIIGWMELVAGTIYTILVACSQGVIMAEKDLNKDAGLEMVLTALLVFTLLVGVLTAILSILLLVGVYKERASFVFTWVVSTSVLLVLGFIGEVSMSIAVKGFNPGDWISIIVQIYYIVVVYSYYVSLKEGRQAQEQPGLVYVEAPSNQYAPPPYSPVYKETYERLPSKN